jgi:hypothetical protein
MNRGLNRTLPALCVIFLVLILLGLFVSRAV